MSRHEESTQFVVPENDDLRLLRWTRDAILRRGWCTRRLVDSEGRVCLLGAMLVALRGDPVGYTTGDYPVLARLVRPLGFHEASDQGAVSAAACWNNSSTQDAVEARLDETIKRLEALA